MTNMMNTPVEPRPDSALEVAGELAKPTEQHLRTSLEIDDKVRRREPLVEQLGDLLVESDPVGIGHEPGADRDLG